MRIAIALIMVSLAVVAALGSVFKSMDTAEDAAEDIGKADRKLNAHIGAYTDYVRETAVVDTTQDNKIEAQGKKVAEMRDDLKKVQRDVADIKEKTGRMDTKLDMLLER